MLQAAAVATAFNLICSGTMQTTALSGTTSEPYRYEYRIDLTHNRWCEGDCRAPHEIAAVRPTVLTLEADRDADTPDRREFFSGSIDRESGHQRILSESGRGAAILIIKWEGQCERAPFAGFPAFETRF